MSDQPKSFGVQILVVDDDPMNGELVKLRLANISANITCALDGNEAVALVKMQKYNLILMDIQMPNLDGVRATQQIRQLSNGFDVPILATTANPTAQQRAHYLEVGMTGFILKPFIAADLLKAVRRWVSPR